MNSQPPSSQSNNEEREVPPAVLCAVCGGWDCSTCEAASSQPLEPTLAWEGAGSVAERLWRTAHATSSNPRGVFGTLGDGSIGSALTFAFLAETLAIGSCAALLALTAFGVAPAFSMRVVTHPRGLAYLLGGVATVSSIMVALHAVWGACLEFGGGTTRTGLRQGLRFGLYACGWDLLTSPAGVVEGVLRRGPGAMFRSLTHAIRAPRPAVEAYQRDNRHFEPSGRRRGLRLSLIVLGGTLLMLIPATGFALFDFAEWLFSL